VGNREICDELTSKNLKTSKNFLSKCRELSIYGTNIECDGPMVSDILALIQSNERENDVDKKVWRILWLITFNAYFGDIIQHSSQISQIQTLLRDIVCQLNVENLNEMMVCWRYEAEFVRHGQFETQHQKLEILGF